MVMPAPSRTVGSRAAGQPWQRALRPLVTREPRPDLLYLRLLCGKVNALTEPACRLTRLEGVYRSPSSPGNGATLSRSRYDRDPSSDHRRRQLSPTGLADRPRQADHSAAGARARERAMAGAGTPARP